MTSRKWLLAAAAIAAVASGCAYDPAYDNYYGYNNGYYGNGYASNNPYYNRGYAYDPYYVAPPSVAFSFGYTYGDKHYYDGHRWHHWDGRHWG